MSYNLIIFYAIDQSKEADYEFEEDVEELGYAQAITRLTYYVRSRYSGSEAFQKLTHQMPGHMRLLVIDATNNTYHDHGVNSHIINHIREHWTAQLPDAPLTLEE